MKFLIKKYRMVDTTLSEDYLDAQNQYRFLKVLRQLSILKFKLMSNINDLGRPLVKYYE